MFNEFFNDFFGDDFALGFGKPTLLYYNTPHTRDMNPAYWQKQESRDSEEDKFDIYRAMVRSVGVSKENVEIKVDGNNLNVSGKTKTNGNDYNFACTLPVADTILENIDHIYYDSIDGITYIYLYVKKNKDNKIKIEQKNLNDKPTFGCSHSK